MVIKAVKLHKDGYMLQPFVMGGEEGADKFDPNVRYRSSLQNYLIDTGKEVILVDTGFPKEQPEQIPDEKTVIFTGNIISDYVSALKTAGYRPEQITKILVTHKHSDHSGELRSFPNATIYCGKEEKDSEELKSLKNVVAATFEDGPYHNFPKSQKVAEGVYYIPAPGHTNGNCIVVAEDQGLFYMIQGDVTYSDEALYANKLSIIFEDLNAAKNTLNQIREFIRKNPTVYLSTHTPLGYENLESKRVCDLDNPPEIIPPKEAVVKTATGKYVCTVCGYVYDPAIGDPANGIPAGTKFEDLPENWHCPICKAAKSKFSKA